MGVESVTLWPRSARGHIRRLLLRSRSVSVRCWPARSNWLPQFLKRSVPAPSVSSRDSWRIGPDTSWRIVSSDVPVGVLALTEPRSLVVIGAPRGTWIHRLVFSPAAKLRSRAPAGTVMVRSAPRRVFHYAQQPVFWVGPQLQLNDAAEVMRDAVAPVVDLGVLVGIIRRSATATPGARTVQDVMEDVPLITITDPIAALDKVADFFEGAPIPIVDAAGRFVASVDPGKVRLRKSAHPENRRKAR